MKAVWLVEPLGKNDSLMVFSIKSSFNLYQVFLPLYDAPPAPLFPRVPVRVMASSPPGIGGIGCCPLLRGLGAEILSHWYPAAARGAAPLWDTGQDPGGKTGAGDSLTAGVSCLKAGK